MLRALTPRLLQALAAVAPDTADRLGGTLGILAAYVGLRRTVVRSALADLGFKGSRRRCVTLRCYASIGASFLALFAGAPQSPARGTRVRVLNPRWLDRVRRSPGMAVITGHLGSWDEGGSLLSRFFGGLTVFATPQHDPGADAVINARRRAMGMEVLLAAHGNRGGAVAALRLLRSGHPVGFLADQGPPPQRGRPGWFLGRACWCHPGPAFLALRAGAVMAPAFCLRTGAGRFVLFMGRPVEGDDEDSLFRHAMDCMSAMVWAFPGQYFWHHRRFKHQAPTPPWPDSGRWRSLRVLVDPSPGLRPGGQTAAGR